MYPGVKTILVLTALGLLATYALSRGIQGIIAGAHRDRAAVAVVAADGGPPACHEQNAPVCCPCMDLEGGR